MKNILMSIITLLVVILAVMLMVQGISIGKLNIMNIKEIVTASKELDAGIEKLNDFKNTTYKKKMSDLNSATKSLTTSKQKYLDLASVSSEEEIKAATVTQKYSMEYLWSKLGNYATKEGVNVKIVVQTTGIEDKSNIDFTVVGSYISIINYISDIEDDSELGFRIEKFKLVGSSDTLNATFSVSNIGIKAENVSNSVSSSNTENNTNTDNNSSQNTVNDTTNNTTNNTVGQ